MYIPDQYIKNLSGYFNVPGGLNLSVNDKIRYRHFIRLKLNSIIEKGLLKPKSLSESISALKFKVGNNSAGYPYFRKKGLVLDTK